MKESKESRSNFSRKTRDLKVRRQDKRATSTVRVTPEVLKEQMVSHQQQEVSTLANSTQQHSANTYLREQELKRRTLELVQAKLSLKALPSSLVMELRRREASLINLHFLTKPIPRALLRACLATL